MNLPARIEIHEEGVREGFQMESARFSIAERLSLIDALANTGLPQIQVGSFVNPGKVPQMADVGELFAALDKRPGVRYTGLWLNEKGFDRAAQTPQIDLEGVLYFYASDAFCRRNNGVPAEEHADHQRQWIKRYRAHGIAVEKAYLMTAFGCNFEGPVSLSHLRQRLRKIASIEEECGVQLSEIYLADTVGWANPNAIKERIAVAREIFPRAHIGLHLHDTRGCGMANALAALQEGVDRFDASIAGLGGCPFSGHSHGGATGNICTEDLVFMCHEMGIKTGTDLELLIEAARLAERIIGRRLDGRIMHSGSLARFRR